MIFYVKQGPVLNFTNINLLNCLEDPNLLFIMLIIEFFMIVSEQEKWKNHFFYDLKSAT